MSPQVWFVSGASSGLGEAFAREAIARGHYVVAAARSMERLRTLESVAPGRVVACTLDLTRGGDAEKAVETALDAFGRIDVLVNNAGGGMLGSLEDTPGAELRALFELNFFGAVALTRAALPHMRARKHGTVVNVSSYMGQLSAPGLSAYSATKFALEGMSEALAAEVAPLGIRVLIVEPGGFRTRITGAGFRMMPVTESYREALRPLREAIESVGEQAPGDPARAAAALATLLDRDDLPLRIQFGRDSVEAIRAHATALLRDLQQWQTVAASTDATANPAPAAAAMRP